MEISFHFDIVRIHHHSMNPSQTFPTPPPYVRDHLVFRRSCHPEKSLDLSLWSRRASPLSFCLSALVCHRWVVGSEAAVGCPPRSPSFPWFLSCSHHHITHLLSSRQANRPVSSFGARGRSPEDYRHISTRFREFFSLSLLTWSDAISYLILGIIPPDLRLGGRKHWFLFISARSWMCPLLIYVICA